MNIYYVYAYIRESNGTPYYIGKGKGNRAYKGHKHVSVPKDRTKIVFLEKNLTNIGALALESRYIQWYGRKNIDENGILLNIAPGGECGNRGKTRKGQTTSEEHKKLLSVAAKKQWVEGRANIDLSKMKDGTRAKYGVDNVWHLKGECPHCGKQGQLTALKRWHFDNCSKRS